MEVSSKSGKWRPYAEASLWLDEKHWYRAGFHHSIDVGKISVKSFAEANLLRKNAWDEGRYSKMSSFGT